MNQYKQDILAPSKMWSRSEVLNQKPCPVPQESGVYAWYFKQIPSIVPVQDCHRYNDLALLYVGIAPSKPASSNNLRNRIRIHFRGDADSSTLRQSIGCLLAEELNIELRRADNGKVAFGPGETKLSNWMEQNALVTWTLHPEPWLLEKELIQGLSLPLNLRGNESHPFYQQLFTIRRQAKERARNLPIID
ncbi:MAG: GIY-YIG nuclease family protein [Chloroflexi bacterium]|nr:GIY-YIG nuclease family protein [Chloroflexota bacterium]